MIINCKSKQPNNDRYLLGFLDGIDMAKSLGFRLTKDDEKYIKAMINNYKNKRYRK